MNPSRSAALLAILVAVPPLAAQGSVLQHLPPNTIFAVSMPDLVTSAAQFQQMPLAKMFAEEETQNFLGDALELAKKKFDEAVAQGREMHARGELPVDPDDLLKLKLTSAAFALTQFEIEEGDFGPMPKVGLLVHLDFGDTAAQWHSLVALGLSMLEGSAGPRLVKSESKVGEWQIRSFLPEDIKGSEMGLHVAMIPRGLVIGTLIDDVTAFADNLQKKSPGLGASAHYAAVSKQMQPDGAEFEIFAQWDSLFDIGMNVLRFASEQRPELRRVDMAGVERAVQAMGWHKLGSSGYTSKYVDGKAVWRSFHAPADAGAATDATAVTPRTVDMAFLKWVPKDAVTFSAETIDVTRIYDTLLRGLQAYDPELATKALAHLAEHEKQAGFKIREDLFGSIGDHYVSWSMAVGSISAAPEAAFLLRVTDEAKIVDVLQKVTKLSNGMVELEESEKRGLKTWQLRVNAPPAGGMGINLFDVFRPIFAFKNGYLVAGFSTSDVKRVFQRMEREDDPKNDIRSNKEYVAVASSVPTGVTSIAFADWKTQFESFYQIITGFLAIMPVGDEIPIDMSMLPDSASLTKHLFASVAYTKTDAAGTEAVSIGPFGAEIMVLGVAIAASAMAALLPNMQRF